MGLKSEIIDIKDEIKEDNNVFGLLYKARQVDAERKQSEAER